MAISNGFDTALAPGALMGRIGWQQPTQANSVVLNAANLTSKSGRSFQMFHPMITLQNLRAVVEDENLNDTQFNAFLQDLQKNVIMSVLNAVFNQPQQIESKTIFDRIRRNDIPTQKAGKFCGYRLWVSPGSYAAMISQVSFLFSGNATFNLYLYQDAMRNPIYTTQVNVTGGNETIVTLPEWILRYIDVTNAVQGGVFYLGYYQNDLPANVVALDEFVSQWNRALVFGYTAFEADQTVTGATPDFNRIGVPYTYRTYGMNAEIQAFRDYTNWVVKNASLFDELIGLSMAVLVLGYQTYSARSNYIERITQQMATSIYNEINANGSYVSTPYVAGLKKQIQREVERVQQSVFYNPIDNGQFITTRPQIWDESSSQMLRV